MVSRCGGLKFAVLGGNMSETNTLGWRLPLAVAFGLPVGVLSVLSNSEQCEAVKPNGSFRKLGTLI